MSSSGKFRVLTTKIHIHSENKNKNLLHQQFQKLTTKIYIQIQLCTNVRLKFQKLITKICIQKLLLTFLLIFYSVFIRAILSLKHKILSSITKFLCSNRKIFKHKLSNINNKHEILNWKHKILTLNWKFGVSKTKIRIQSEDKDRKVFRY